MLKHFFEKYPKVYDLAVAVYFFAKRNILYFFWIFPVKKNRLVFISYYGKFYNDNPKAISDELLNQNKDIEIVWLINSLENVKGVSDRVTFVRNNSIKAIYMMATARVWVDNCRKASWMRKRKGQYYIQTWHGSMALKKIEKDAEDVLEKHYVKNAIVDSSMIDLMLANSFWSIELFEKSFWYNGEVLKCGSPRLDKLLNMSAESQKKIRRTLEVRDSDKVILYAPTFRNNQITDVYDINYDRMLENVRLKFGSEWKVLLRLHPNMSNIELSIDDGSVKNVTAYPDLYELLGICDILITDYSSSMFEAGFANKKVILYASDLQDYTDDRGFYFDLSDLPYPLANNNDELENIISTFDEMEYEKKLMKFNNSFGVLEDGLAALRAVEKILVEIGYKDI